jgi:hypothetical protein
VKRRVIKLEKGARRLVEEVSFEPVLDDELPAFVELFKRWYGERR